MTDPLKNHAAVYFGRPSNVLNPFSAVCEGWFNQTTGLGVYEQGKRYYFKTNYKLPKDFDPIGKTRQEIQDVAFGVKEK